jgi:hypothetical protein
MPCYPFRCDAVNSRQAARAHQPNGTRDGVVLSVGTVRQADRNKLSVGHADGSVLATSAGVLVRIRAGSTVVVPLDTKFFTNRATVAVGDAGFFATSRSRLRRQRFSDCQ